MSDVRGQLKSFLKKIPIGRRGSTAKRAARQLLKGFARFDIDLVFDVGANTGQFASQIRGGGYHGRIVSFEPLTDAHRKLSEAAAKDSAWIPHERCALGALNGSTILNIAGNSVSSSLRAMTSAHSNAAPGSAVVGQEMTPVFTLDSIAPQYLRDAGAPFLKIDTQGFEWEVLEGSRETIPRIRGILCELSLVTLYDGQRLWREMVDRLESEGFVLWGLQPTFMDRHGRNLQTDAIFFRI